MERRFSYALSREDIENAILGGPWSSWKNDSIISEFLVVCRSLIVCSLGWMNNYLLMLVS